MKAPVFCNLFLHSLLTTYVLNAIIKLSKQMFFSKGEMLYSMETVCLASLERRPDTSTPTKLLPQHLCGGDNSRRLAYLKNELRYVIKQRLSESQRECIILHYWRRMRRKDIAQHLGIGAPQVTKNIQNAENLIREHLEHYSLCYDRLERELLNSVTK